MRVLVFVCMCMCTHTHTHTHKLHSQILGSNTKSVHPAYSVLPIGESHRSLCCIQKGRCTSCVPTWKAMICEDTTRTITQVLKEGPKIVFFFNIFIYYLSGCAGSQLQHTAPSVFVGTCRFLSSSMQTLSCSTWDLSSLTRGRTWI